MHTNNKRLFETEFQIHSSIKMLYPYLNTAGGLSQWFADDVKTSPEKIFTFIWENEEHKARLANFRTNHFIRFEYLPETDADKEYPAYFEIHLEVNELTQSTFIHIKDYTDFEDFSELQQIWAGMIENLKEVVGH